MKTRLRLISVFCTLPKILFALAAVAAFGTVQPAKANLVTNGDFETGNFIGWTVTHAASGGNISVNHGPGPDTTFGAFFGAGGSDFDSISQTFATTPGASYTLTFFYQVTNLGTPIPANNEFDVLWNGVSIGGGLFPQSNVNPGNITPTFHLTATGTSTTLEFDGRNAPSFDFLDNVSVTPGVIDTGSTISLLPCALIGLAGLQRKFSAIFG